MADSDFQERTREFNETAVAAGSGSGSLSLGHTTHTGNIGRYRIARILGKGGYGVVYLAYDEQLERHVAIKVPHLRLISMAESTDASLTEARMVAKLDHPHIVPVYDIGSVDTCPYFIVSKYIEGTDLSGMLKAVRPSYFRTVEMVSMVADALDYAHGQGLIHRDVKPGNILIDKEQNPWLADFGLAVHEDEIARVKQQQGTTSYMSPEQIRCEGHRIDARSDVFSLGVVLYQMLAGERPFAGRSTDEIFRQITHGAPRPLRQFDRSLPKDLERICQKALAKRVTERYASALEFSDDLQSFLHEQSSVAETDDTIDRPTRSTQSISDKSGLDSESDHPTRESGESMASWKTKPTIRIIPKGLRSFEEHDAEFFLDLLPGPRDRHGIPEAIRFWNHRIEQMNSDRTFSVGLIYGPSGCGKSSFVKAGLLPTLPEHVCTVYAEALATETESRLLHLIQNQTRGLDANLGLKETLTAVRRGQGLASGQKLLIVIDQFEQWLHVHKDIENTELVDALRQCDGGRVQCILMVRDEFWLALSRFMRALEIGLEDGQNSALVDLFDQRHAEKVLSAFGVAYGLLPEFANQMSKDQRGFVKQAICDLSNDGKVVCVRLAFFAEMMKSKPWTVDGLQHVGGTLGVGEMFLEETFSVPTAPLKHRHHELAVRSVLKALLPEPGTDIKGQMKPREALRQISGYAEHPKKFEELVGILDNELRLISAVDTAGYDPTRSTAVASESGQAYYQLTHDYLVHALRGWLTRKQQETRRGRAELRLAERSALWNARPERQQLPTGWEYLNIKFFTEATKRSPQERKLLQHTRRHHFFTKGTLALVLAVGSIASWLLFASVREHATLAARRASNQISEHQAENLVRDLRHADTKLVPEIVTKSESHPRWAAPLIEEAFHRSEDGSREKLNFSIVFSKKDDRAIRYLSDSLPKLDAIEFDVVLTALGAKKGIASERIWSNLENDRIESDSLLQTGIALATLSPDDTRWDQLAPAVSRQLTRGYSSETNLKRLSPVSQRLIKPLQKTVQDDSAPLVQRRHAAIALCRWLDIEQQISESLPDVLVEWILETKDTVEFQTLLRALRPHSYGVRAHMRMVHDSDGGRGTFQRKMNAAAVLIDFGDADKICPLLRHSANPSVRNQLIDRQARLGVNAQALADQLDRQQIASVRQGLVLILGGVMQGLSADEQKPIHERLKRLYRDDPDAGVHSAIRWTLRQHPISSEIVEIDHERSRQDDRGFSGERNWTVNSISQTYLRIPPPTVSPAEDASGGKPLKRLSFDYTFAIAATEVTIAEFRKFRPRHQHDSKYASDIRCPVNDVSWYDAIAFCNWLSEQEGLTRCYELDDQSEGIRIARIPEDFLQRNGYRLPTARELEYCCRAGTDTAYSFGNSDELLGEYAWFEENSNQRSRPVGMKRPNAWGAFDTHGSLWEWSTDLAEVTDGVAGHLVTNGDAMLLLGGAFDNATSRVQSGERLVHFPHEYKYSYGFRPARTVSTPNQP